VQRTKQQSGCADTAGAVDAAGGGGMTKAPGSAREPGAFVRLDGGRAVSAGVPGDRQLLPEG